MKLRCKVAYFPLRRSIITLKKESVLTWSDHFCVPPPPFPPSTTLLFDWATSILTPHPQLVLQFLFCCCFERQVPWKSLNCVSAVASQGGPTPWGTFLGTRWPASRMRCSGASQVCTPRTTLKVGVCFTLHTFHLNHHHHLHDTKNHPESWCLFHNSHLLNHHLHQTKNHTESWCLFHTFLLNHHLHQTKNHTESWCLFHTSHLSSKSSSSSSWHQEPPWKLVSVSHLSSKSSSSDQEPSWKLVSVSHLTPFF